jgi:hypothetical protein
LSSQRRWIRGEIHRSGRESLWGRSRFDFFVEDAVRLIQEWKRIEL